LTFPAKAQLGATYRGVARAARCAARPAKSQAAAQRWGALVGLARMQAPSCAERAHPPGSRRHARRCRRSEARLPVLSPATDMLGSKPGSYSAFLPARRRRAQEHELSWSSSSPRAATRAARLAGVQALSARWCARATAVPKARRASPFPLVGAEYGPDTNQ
jgi:hypothetical protein